MGLRLICRYPLEKPETVVALSAGDRASRGDVFCNSVGTRADQMLVAAGATDPRIVVLVNGHDVMAIAGGSDLEFLRRGGGIQAAR